MAVGENGKKKRHPHWGRRQRRLRTTAAVLAAVVVVAAAALLWRSPETEVYRPGEENPDITRNLDRDLPAGAPLPVFTDVTEAAGLASFQSFAGERTSQLPEDMGSGLAWGDYDRDGDDDLFLVSNGAALNRPEEERAPSELYENLGDGTFRRVGSFPETRIVGMAAAWGDYTGDGWDDLVVTGFGALRLFRNEEGTLVRDTSFPEVDGYWAAAVWGDYDNDRDLDLYVCGYVGYVAEETGRGRSTKQYGAAVPYTLNPSSYEPSPNLLFRNDGGGGFTEVAAELGVANPEGRSLGALWHDFDDDGWLDLYVGNDVSDNVLYRNRGGTFEDTSHQSWVADYRGAMGLAAGDYDRDGDDDLFVTHWVGQENALYNSLYRDMAERSGDKSRAELGFTDRAAPLGLGQIALRFVGWGTEFADFDSDGWLDLVVMNGSTFETDDEPPKLKAQEALFLWSQKGEFFHDLASAIDALATPKVGRGLAVSDYDGDGDLDLAVVHHGEGMKLLRNDTKSGGWAVLRLRNRLGADARGARVVATVGDALLRRSITGASYLSQSSAAVHLGLGTAERIDSLEVRWPGGETETFTDLEANAFWEIREGEDAPRRLGGTAMARGLDERERVLAFWEKHRAGVKVLKIEGDVERASELFRQALEYDPSHEDALYYLGNCLLAMGRTQEGLAQLKKLQEINPLSLRAFKQWGAWRALTARSPEDLAAAERSLERALEINKEETGALLVLGEMALMRGDSEEADQRFEWACRTNPQAVGGFYLRGYLAWKRGDGEAVTKHLDAARAARGPEWKPEGSVAEGDVERKVHREETPLARFWRGWDAASEGAEAFVELERFLADRSR